MIILSLEFKNSLRSRWIQELLKTRYIKSFFFESINNALFTIVLNIGYFKVPIIYKENNEVGVLDSSKIVINYATPSLNKLMMSWIRQLIKKQYGN